MNDDVLLQGFGAGGYRSIQELQPIGPLRKVTLIAGQNNSGKSNILRFAQNLLTKRFRPLEWVDLPKLGGPLRLQVAYSLANAAARLGSLNDVQKENLLSLLREGAFSHLDDGNVWLTYSSSEPKRPQAQQEKISSWHLDEDFLNAALRAKGARDLYREVSSGLTGRGGGSTTDDITRVLEHLFPFTTPPVRTVEAFRQISTTVNEGAENAALSEDFNGKNLIQRLARLQNPPTQRWEIDRPRFDAITQFARTVLEDDDVEITISGDQDEIQVHQHGRVLPLTSLGTGMHQVIILAAAATLLEQTLVCIEEPELHLHPLLQRKLVRYLSEATSNQYLIATHSAHLLDYERAAVLHVKHDRHGGTLVAATTTPQSISDLCNDLGYRPSDLIQANAVIWVEGPSDRIYLRHWLEMVAPGEFIEGIHYSVMFYGGGLVAHLTADDPLPGIARDTSVDDFISLRRLNRHSAIIIDSDKTSRQSRINDTKIRVRDEFDRKEMPGFAWITACRTIENYVPVETLTAAVKVIHPKSTHRPPNDKWQDPLHITKSREKRSMESVNPEKKGKPDKVSVAREACDLWPAGTLPWDLRSRMEQTVEFIRRANGSTRHLPSMPAT